MHKYKNFLNAVIPPWALDLILYVSCVLSAMINKAPQCLIDALAVPPWGDTHQ